MQTSKRSTNVSLMLAQVPNASPQLQTMSQNKNGPDCLYYIKTSTYSNGGNDSAAIMEKAFFTSTKYTRGLLKGLLAKDTICAHTLSISLTLIFLFKSTSKEISRSHSSFFNYRLCCKILLVCCFSLICLYCSVVTPVYESSCKCTVGKMESEHLN